MPRNKVDLRRLELFAAVAETGSFTAAAERLGVTKAVVSQHVRRLEKTLGADLFSRTTRRVSLTESGRQLQERALPLMGQLDRVLAGLAIQSQTLAGTLRVTSTADYLENVLASHLADFGRLHPRLRIEVIASDHPLDLIAEGIDVAIRLGWPRKSSLHATRLASFDLQPVAAPACVELVGTPTHPRDLTALQWLEHSLLPAPATLAFNGPSGQRAKVRLISRFRCNAPTTLLALARSGAGFTVAADFVVAADIAAGRLVRLLPRWSLPRGGIYAVYTSIQHPQPKVRLLIDFIKSRQRGSNSAAHRVG